MYSQTLPHSHTKEYTECLAFYLVIQIESPHHLIRKRVLSPPLWVQGETHSHAEEGVGAGGNQFRRWDKVTDTLVLWVYYAPSTLHITTAHYKSFIFLGDLDSVIQICIPILHRNPLYACYPIKEPNHKESVSRDWAFFWNVRVG